jgi:two-component system repressor protein LuxO
MLRPWMRLVKMALTGGAAAWTGPAAPRQRRPEIRRKAPEPVFTAPLQVEAQPPPPAALQEPELLPMKEIERRAILAALRRTERDVPRAATLLDINPSTIFRRLITWREEGTLPSEFA